MKKKRQLQPYSDLKSQAAQRMDVESKKYAPRQFRDMLTRAKGSTTSMPTNASQWGRWTP